MCAQCVCVHASIYACVRVIKHVYVRACRATHRFDILSFVALCIGIPTPLLRILLSGLLQVTWFLDGLPASVRMVEEDNPERSHLERGFPLGVAAPLADGSGVKESYLFNHIVFRIQYNKDEAASAAAAAGTPLPEEEEGKFRVVGFEVEPHTLKHKMKVRNVRPLVSWASRWSRYSPSTGCEGERWGVTAMPPRARMCVCVCARARAVYLRRMKKYDSNTQLMPCVRESGSGAT